MRWPFKKDGKSQPACDKSPYLLNDTVRYFSSPRKDLCEITFFWEPFLLLLMEPSEEVRASNAAYLDKLRAEIKAATDRIEAEYLPGGERASRELRERLTAEYGPAR